MKNIFYHTFKPVTILIHFAGVYLPKSETVYPLSSKLVRPVVHFILLFGVSMFGSLSGGMLAYLIKGEKTEGMVKYYMTLGMGTLAPSSIKMIYLQLKNKEARRIMDIWERDLIDPPHPEDRKLEIAIVQKAAIRILKIQVFGLIIPLMLWTSRPLITNVEVVPTAFPGNHYESPTFGYITALVVLAANHISSGWSAFESLQILFINSILAEVNHLSLAIEKMFTVPQAPKEDQLPWKEIFEAKDTNDLSTTQDDFKIYHPVGTISDEKIREVRQTLRIWVRHHQNVLRFSNAINEFLGPMIMLQALSTIIFGFTSLFIVVMGELRIDNRIEAGGYLVFYYFMMLLTCILGDNLQIKSKNIMLNFQGKQWYLFPKDIVKRVLIIQQITLNRPIKLTAYGYKDVSCRTFEEISQKGYELVTLMGHLLSRNLL